ncbi:GNAT family N-acetyltransferase [Miltoncostaea oceani]|uniref:GNAT family N-acetyltransferase n=1 Tax=Miltoncostaea oceani TaxID=2843216 RepID=UPI001C3E3F31|nr:GNAT family protein [Miltoncostaea oceani]
MTLWPPFDIRISTPGITLRLASDPELEDLAVAACGGILAPGEEKFLTRWAQASSPAFERGFMAYHWRCRGEAGPTAWSLPFCVFLDDQAGAVGVQELSADHFSDSLRVRSGSWLLASHRGRGIGTQIRVMALEFAFRALGARDAITSALASNGASTGVSLRAGYRPIGEHIAMLDGVATRLPHFLLAREDWIFRPDILISGHEASLEMLGAPRRTTD